MNKITTSILAGVALAALAAAPASADNGIFAPLGTAAPVFAFSPVGTFNGYTLTAAPVTYYTGIGGPASFGTTGTLSITATGLIAGTSYSYSTSTLNFTPTAGQGAGASAAFSETGATSVNLVNGSTFISGAGLSRNDFLNLSYAPVPEASTVISFGALLALGGLAVLRRKSVARAS